MKKILSAAFFVIFACAGTISAGVPTIRVAVPFDFYAGDQLFPAGEYRFDLYGSTGPASRVLIRSESGDGLSYIQTLPSSFSGTKDFKCNITFSQYGSQYFLSKLESGGFEIALPTSRSEERVKLAFKTPSRTTVASVK